MINISPLVVSVGSFYDKLYMGMTKKKHIDDIEYCYETLYRNIKQEIINAENEYKNNKQKLYTLVSENKITDNISKDDMYYLYTNKFVKSNGRKIYDEIMSIPKYNLCPYCRVAPVYNLDHYLPISFYCRFAVIPYNLVPLCFRCNNKKKEYHSSISEETLINPYFDNYIVNKQWLFCNITEKYGGIVADFFVEDKYKKFSNTEISKIRLTFNKLELNEVYGPLSSSTISVYYEKWEEMCLEDKSILIKELKENESLYGKNDQLNSWEHAMYQGLTVYYEFKQTTHTQRDYAIPWSYG